MLMPHRRSRDENRPANGPVASEKTYIDCGFVEKDEVKRLGARYDRQAKRWYIPAGDELGPFGRWLPVPSGHVIEVVVPWGVVPGEQLEVRVPQEAGGGKLLAIVPAGAREGDVFEVST
jgi:hypothetical protein